MRRAHAAVLFAATLLLPALPGVASAQNLTLEDAAAGLKWRQIGPAIMGGRVADLAVHEANPAHFFVGTASGGLWKTTNDGQSWTPVFDEESTASIGAVALAPSNPNIVWVGTGEPQNRQSSPWGDGVFKSVDGGRTWRHVGLRETRHIARIVVHPTNPDVVYVAAVGQLWGPNPERGVFRTRDGGETWEHVLRIDENTGAIDLVMDPGDPRTLFAATYQRRRTSFGFSASGSGSGIHRTVDGGNTWTELTNGLPEGDKGRIGLDVYRRDGNLVYAIVESRQGQGRGIYRSRDRGESWEKVSDTNPRPMYFSLIRIDPNDPERIYIGGVQFGVSDDGGKTFRPGDGARGIHVDHHALWIDPANSNHLILGSDGGLATSWDRSETWRQIDNLALGQFYEIGVDMADPYNVCGGLQDNSSWCAPSNTLSEYGIMNGDWIDVSGGDGFYNKIDPTNPDIIYTESQGGNISRYDRRTGESARIRPVKRTEPGAARATEEEDEDEDQYRFNWNAPIHVSLHDPATIYIGANHLLRSRDRGVTWEEASPDLTRQIDRDTLEIMGARVTDETLSRNDGISNYGNITTVAESPFTADLIYVGTDDGNVQRSRDGGATWTDLTGRIQGLPARTYVSSVVASSAVEGRVYATFDGHYNNDYRPYVYASDDYGERWRPIVTGLPDWSVNRIREHHRTADLLFVGNEIGVYFSPDRGQSWHRLDGNLPTVPVDDIVIHPRDNDLILGTHGRSIWILDDVGPLEQLSRTMLASGGHLFPVRPARLMARAGGWPFWGDEFQGANPPDGAIVRYYLGRDVAGAAAVAEAGRSGDGAARTPGGAGPGNGAAGREPAATRGDGTNGQTGAAGPGNAPAGQEARRGRGSGRAADGGDGPPKVKLTITDATGATVRTLEGEGKAGLHQLVWDLRMDPPYEAEERQGGGGGGGFGGPPRGPKVLPGTYTLALSAGEQEWSTPVRVLPDPRIQISDADRMARQEALLSLHALAKPVYEAGRRVRELTDQVTSVQRMLKDAGDGAPEGLAAEADSVKAELDRVRTELTRISRNARLAGAIEGSTTRPTSDQLWQIDRAWEDAPAAIGRLNTVVTDRLPALNRRLDESGIRPDPGVAVELPRRPGG